MENMKPTRDGKSVQKALDAEIRGATMDDFDRFEYYSMKNGRKIIYLSIIIFVLVSGFFVARSIWSDKNDQIAGVFARAKTVEQLAKALDEYGSSDLSFEPRLRYANLLIESNKAGNKELDEANKQYQYLIKSKAPEIIVNRAKLDQSYVFELRGQFDKAVEEFAAISDAEGLPKYTAAEAAFAAGRIAVQHGNLERGISYLQKAAAALNVSYENSTYSDVAADFYARQAASMLKLINKQQ